MPVDTPHELFAARLRAAEIAQRRSRIVLAGPRRGHRRELEELDLELGELIGGILDRIDPCDASPDVPLVLLPVRIETKTVHGTAKLRVRITPDEVHVDSLLRTLTDVEATAGQAYWSTIWTDAGSVTAWGDLVAAVGPRRAGWIAHATTPTNLAEHGTGAPAFPDAPTELAVGTVARCLPDQFIVRVFPTGQLPITVTGGAVPRELPISPIALGNDEVVDAGTLKVPKGSEWTVDFEQAKAVGLGVEVELPPGTTSIDRIVVVGTRRSVTEDDNAADLTELLTSHRFTDGMSLPAAGTATNNADANRSPYRPDATAGPPAPGPLPATSGAAALGAMLGVDPATIERLCEVSATRSTLDEAQRAANTALWFATWGPVLDTVAEQAHGAVTPGQIESARRVHRDHVRAAGHTPVLRIGAQPYGVLPVTDLGQWQPQGGEISASLVPIVQRTLGRWIARARTIPHIAPGDDVSDADLLEMLGTSPTSIGVRVRPAVSGEHESTLGAATGIDP